MLGHLFFEADECFRSIEEKVFEKLVEGLCVNCLDMERCEHVAKVIFVPVDIVFFCPEDLEFCGEKEIRILRIEAFMQFLYEIRKAEELICDTSIINVIEGLYKDYLDVLIYLMVDGDAAFGTEIAEHPHNYLEENCINTRQQYTISVKISVVIVVNIDERGMLL